MRIIVAAIVATAFLYYDVEAFIVSRSDAHLKVRPSTLFLAKGFAKTPKTNQEKELEFQQALADLQNEDVPILGCGKRVRVYLYYAADF